jgi:hypothetical protein
LRIIERKDIVVSHEWLTNTRVQQAQHGVNIRNGPHRRVRSTPHALLVNDNRHAQIFDGVSIRLGIPGQKGANEGTEGVVQLATRFGGQGIKYDRRFARARHTCKDRNFAFGNAQRYILKVVFAGTSDFDIFLGHDYSLSIH